MKKIYFLIGIMLCLLIVSPVMAWFCSGPPCEGFNFNYYNIYPGEEVCSKYTGQYGWSPIGYAWYKDAAYSTNQYIGALGECEPFWANLTWMHLVTSKTGILAYRQDIYHKISVGYPPEATLIVNPSSGIVGTEFTYTGGTLNTTAWNMTLVNGTTISGTNHNAVIKETVSASGYQGVQFCNANTYGSDCVVEAFWVDTAGFSANTSTGIVPQSVVFTKSASLNTTAVQWTFGDGNVTTTSGVNTIEHIYTGINTYTVSMRYYNTPSTTATVTKYNYITINPGAGSLITPTPTPTPQTTNAPSDKSTITYHIVDYSTNLPLSEVYVQHWVNNYYLGGYTDTDGVITFWNTTIASPSILKAWKTGYQNWEELVYPTPFTFSHYVYMQPSVSTDIQSVNLTITVRDLNGGAAISNAYVTAQDLSLQSVGRVGVTDANGITTINNFPNSNNIGGVISKSGYVSKQWSIGFKPTSSTWTNTFYISTETGVTPTQTPVQYNTTTLSASPTSVGVGNTVTLTTTCSGNNCQRAGGANFFNYYARPNATYIGDVIAQYAYNTTSSGWNYRNSATGTWLVGSYTPTSVTHIPTLPETYTYTVYIYDTNAQSLGTASTTVVVSGAPNAGGLVMTLYAYDKSTTSQLGNYNLNITDLATGVNTNIGNVVYNYNKLLPRGSSQTLYCSKTGYTDASQLFTVPTDLAITQGSVGALMGCGMYPEGMTIGTNTSVVVHVSDAETYFPVGNVLITLTATGVSASPRYTGSDGQSALFLVPYNTSYLVTATKTGYCSVSDSGYTGTNSYQYVPLNMKAGACNIITPTPTLSVTPTPWGWTPTPTITPIGGWGQNNQTARVCMKLPADASYVDIILNTLACNGFKDTQSQNLALSMLIIILAAVIFGKVAGGIGILAGAIVGTVFSIAMGLLPFWIIIVLIILAGLIFATKLWTGE